MMVEAIKSFRIAAICVLSSLLFSNSNGFYNPHLGRPTTARPSPLPPVFKLVKETIIHNQQSCQTLLHAKAVKITNDPWYPLILDNDERQEEVEQQAVQLCTRLIRRQVSGNTTTASADEIAKRAPMIRNRFMDLAC